MVAIKNKTKENFGCGVVKHLSELMDEAQQNTRTLQITLVYTLDAHTL